MKFVLFFILLSVLGFYIFSDVYSALAFGLTLSIGVQILTMSNGSFMFREWALFLYASNYLLSPAVTYLLNSDLIKYGMKIPSEEYFSLAFPGYLLFGLGMFLIPNRIFKPEFKRVNQATLINEHFLVQLTLFGVLLSLVRVIFLDELGFVIYLVSMLRFVGSFSLFATKTSKYSWLAAIVLLLELYYGFRDGMYHDALMWVIFFALFYVYTMKPTMRVKLIGAISLVTFILFIQAIKVTYREQVWFGGKDASIETIAAVAKSKAGSDDMIGENNLLATLNRGNQAWIFASTVEHMDRYKDFQELTIVYRYFESALLPRFIAPNKIKSGDKEIFNQFSGHILDEGTSMGLGIFADGYIAYGASGVYIFGFVLGLIFSLTFKLVEGWTKISPFYVLLLLPMLSYAVRPDCELQTTINHLAKSIVVFGALVYVTKHRFTLNSAENQRKMLHLNLMK